MYIYIHIYIYIQVHQRVLNPNVLSSIHSKSSPNHANWHNSSLSNTLRNETIYVSMSLNSISRDVLTQVHQPTCSETKCSLLDSFERATESCRLA